MRTYTECIPCFLSQALEMARLVTGNELVHKEILDEVARLVPSFSLGCTPPEMARMIQKVLNDKIGPVDFYKQIKGQSNDMALALYPKLKQKVRDSANPLLTAVEIAIAGNVIDYAAKNTLNIEKEIENLFIDGCVNTKKTVFDFESFAQDAVTARRIVYLADNAGEVVFDRVLIEEFGPEAEVIYAVRDKPVINDALIEDARKCGIEGRARIMSSGVDAPGTILRYCSEEFKNVFRAADMIISKGQGNYEALSEEKGRIYFLFRAKCPVIARHANVPLADAVLLKQVR